MTRAANGETVSNRNLKSGTRIGAMRSAQPSFYREWVRPPESELFQVRAKIRRLLEKVPEKILRDLASRIELPELYKTG